MTATARLSGVARPNPANQGPVRSAVAFGKSGNGAEAALSIAREHIRWAYSHGMTRDQIAASVGAAGYLKRRGNGSLLVPLAAAWLGLNEH